MKRVLKILFLFPLLVSANEQLTEEEIVVKKIKEYPYLLAYVDSKYKDDEQLVSIAIEKNGRILQYASQRLKDDDELVYKAVRNNGGGLAYASTRLRDDEDIVSMAMDSYGSYLQYASKRLRDDEDIVMDALRSNGANLQYASKRLRDDKWYVNLAIKNNASALEYASQRLQNHKDLVLLSVRTYSSNLSYASEQLQDDKSLVMEAIKQDGRALRYVSKRLKSDKEVVLLAIKKEKKNLAYASKALQDELGIKKRDKIKIEFQKNPKNLASMPLGIESSLALKSIKIKHKNKLIGHYKVPKGEPIDYYTSLNLSASVALTGHISIELKEKNGKIHTIQKKFVANKEAKTTSYMNKEDALNSMTEQKYKRHILKLRVKDELAYGAFMLMHPMFSEQRAKKLGLKADYIEQVTAKIGDKVVFDFHGSSMLRADPFFRFTFHTAKKSGKLEIIVKDNRGKEQRFYKAYKL